MKDINDHYQLSNGVKHPCLGFGTYKAADGKTAEVLKTAIEAGYRYFDTASFYGTEPYVGQAIRESGCKREDFFITSKVWKTDMGYDNVKKAFEESLHNLGTEYLDMYLIHWPRPSEDYEDWKALDIDTWRGMEELYRDGRVKAIGVSNFLPHHIENLLQNCDIRPVADQIEFHPGYTQEMTVAYCQEKNILVQAWSPIGRSVLLHHPLIVEMAARYGVSEAQLCLRYAVQRGVVPLPKSSSPERMRQNQEVFHFSISKEDMMYLGTMAPAGWSGEHPDGGGTK